MLGKYRLELCSVRDRSNRVYFFLGHSTLNSIEIRFQSQLLAIAAVATTRASFTVTLYSDYVRERERERVSE